MHRYTKEQKRRNTKVQIHTNTKVQMHKTQNTTDLLPSPCNVLDRRPSSADNHPKTCVCRCNCHHSTLSSFSRLSSLSSLSSAQHNWSENCKKGGGKLWLILFLIFHFRRYKILWLFSWGITIALKNSDHNYLTYSRRSTHWTRANHPGSSNPVQ